MGPQSARDIRLRDIKRSSAAVGNDIASVGIASMVIASVGIEDIARGSCLNRPVFAPFGSRVLIRTEPGMASQPEPGLLMSFTTQQLRPKPT